MNDNVLALSWNIATEPKLYRQLASNPYSPAALQIISERFPDAGTFDIIKAIILAEPEGRYDRIFRQLPQELREAEIYKQTNETYKITRRLNKYYSQHLLKFTELSEGLIYDILFKTAFKTTDLQKVEQGYAQNQRRGIKLLILNFMNEVQSTKPIDRFINIDYYTPVTPKSHRKTFSRIGFAVLSLISFFYLAFIFLDKHSLAVKAANQIAQARVENTAFAQETTRTLPTRLKIPSINVDAGIEYMGLTPGGAMDVPSNTIDVGWYTLGPSPGETGSAVIAGHFNGIKGESGVFKNLDKLKQGDKLYVIDDQGITTAFVVRESRTYNPGYADEVFFPNDSGIHLNLITCDGVWDKNKKSYSKRLVVFADITH